MTIKINLPDAFKPASRAILLADTILNVITQSDKPCKTPPHSFDELKDLFTKQHFSLAQSFTIGAKLTEAEKNDAKKVNSSFEKITQDKPASREGILKAAHEWTGTPYLYGGNSESGIDCTHFINQTYLQAGINYSYRSTASDWTKAGFKNTTDPKAGDVILWDGHAGIVVDPDKKIFIGAQSSTGVAEASYDKGKYWGKKSFQFLTHEKLQNE